QTLFRRVDQPGMVPCCEILLCTSAVRNCIRENRIFEIPNIIETSRRLGMQTMESFVPVTPAKWKNSFRQPRRA
ncbi:MAG: type IV pili twitching motility protein PilT, partial [Planctomycetota bacterium]